MNTPSVTEASIPILQELVERYRKLYEGPEIDAKLERLSRGGSPGRLSAWDIHRLLRTSRSVYFDTHVEVVSGHHTATYVRFESIARFPQLVTLIARDMAEWLVNTFHKDPLAGIVATSSDARLLAEKVRELLADRMPLRIVLTPFNRGTGKIGTDVPPGSDPNGRSVCLVERCHDTRHVREQAGHSHYGSSRPIGGHDGVCQTRQRAISIDGRADGEEPVLFQRRP